MRRSLVGAAMLALLGTPAAAGELADFNAAVDAAMDPQRAALFYLRTGNAPVAEIELDAAAQAWQAVAAQWGETPPDAFDGVAAWPKRIAAVGDGLAAARTAAAAGDADTATDTLGPVGEAVAALRAEAGVVVFADRVAEANRAMEALWIYRREGIDWADAAQVNDLRARTAVTAYLYGELKRTAAPEVAADPEFARLVDGTLSSLALMWGAIDRQEAPTVVNILREIRSFDDLLWLRFG